MEDSNGDGLKEIEEASPSALDSTTTTTSVASTATRTMGSNTPDSVSHVTFLVRCKESKRRLHRYFQVADDAGGRGASGAVQ